MAGKIKKTNTPGVEDKWSREGHSGNGGQSHDWDHGLLTREGSLARDSQTSKERHAQGEHRLVPG